MIRAILFEDNKNYREALVDSFSDSDQVFLAGAFPNAEKVIKQIQDYQPDIILMDIEMPGISGLDALQKIKKYNPEIKVLIQTQFEDEHRIFLALCRGAWGYVLKTDTLDRLEEAIVNVHHGGGYFSSKIANKVIKLFQEKIVQETPEYISLSDGELEVLQLLGKGLKYQAIADQLFLSYEAVHSRIKKIYVKLHVNSRSEAIIKAIESKLIN